MDETDLGLSWQEEVERAYERFPAAHEAFEVPR